MTNDALSPLSMFFLSSIYALIIWDDHKDNRLLNWRNLCLRTLCVTLNSVQATGNHILNIRNVLITLEHGGPGTLPVRLSDCTQSLLVGMDG